MLPVNKYYLCSNRSIISVEGSDKLNFLQGMVSNNLEDLKEKKSIYCAHLTPQGKFLYDFFIFDNKKNFFLECLSISAEEIINRFSLFKLRANVNFEIQNDYVSLLIGVDTIKKIEHKLIEKLVLFKDPRNTNFFVKIYCRRSVFEQMKKELSLCKLSHSEFDRIRIENVIPNSEKDFKKNKMLLLEARFDKLNGISWTKGCYIGQEVTAITNYRGKLKKQIYGVKIHGKNLSNDVFMSSKNVGVLTSRCDNFGIAILNIKETEDSISSKVKFTCGNGYLEPFTPKWSLR